MGSDLLSACPCGAWVAWGSLSTPEERVAWATEHAACGPAERPREPTHASIRCETEAEAIEIARLMRPSHIVGRLGASLLVRPRF